jgi:hypothetical protein
MEPTFTADGYPTDDTLEAIESWGIKDFQDAIDLMEFVGMAWSYPDRWKVERQWEDDLGHKKARYIFSTGGWSGNEDLVGAMENNPMLRILGPWSWQRGGHYEYRLPEKP